MTKFSQIALAPIPPALTDTVIGVGDGTDDYQYTLEQISQTLAFDLMLTDGMNAVADVATITIIGGTVGGSSPNATITIESTPGPVVTDGTHSVANVEQIAVIGGQVSGTTPNATITIVGAGDPLLLEHGLTVNATDPNVTGNPNDAQAVSITATYDKLVTNIGYTDQNAVEITENFLHGINQYNDGTNAKTTPIALNVTHNATGAGEHFAGVFTMNGYGMSDTFLFSGGVGFATGPIEGDEGQGFSPEFYCRQQPNVTQAHVTSVARTTFSTTITQNVTGSQNAQSITVASTSGANVGDWIVFGQAAPAPATNICCAKIISIGSGSINCICPNNFSSGATITPALCLGVDTYNEFGQDRVLVNLSESVYQTGQVYQTGGGNLTGVGTSWAANMVGGTATNIGAISVDQDIYSDDSQGNFLTPFLSWYPIEVITNTTSLAVLSLSVADDQSYHGNALTETQLTSSTVTITINSPAVVTWDSHGLPVGTAVRFTTTGTLPTGITANTPYFVASATTNTFQLATLSSVLAGDRVNTTGSQSGTHTCRNGGYSIRPSARILWVAPVDDGRMICESSSATWDIGDLVECTICPYPDVHGWDYRIGVFGPGGTKRQMLGLYNQGARMFGSGISIGNAGATIGNTNSDAFGWQQGILIESAQIGVLIMAPTGANASPSPQSAISIQWDSNTPVDAGAQIIWGTGNYYVTPNTPNAGMDIQLTSGGAAGLLRAIGATENLDGSRAQLSWSGYLQISDTVGEMPYIRLGGNQVAASSIGTMDIKYRYYGVTSLGGTGLGIDFIANDVADTATNYIFSINGLGGGGNLGGPTAASQGTATSGITNHSSWPLNFLTSVWNGSAAITQYGYVQVVPASGNSAPLSFQFALWDNINNNKDFLNIPLQIRTDGLLTFGLNNTASGDNYQLSLSTANLTAQRTVSFPDAAGAAGVVVAGSHTPASSTAAGSPGEIEYDGSYLYVCVASSTWIRAALTGGW